MNQDDRFDAFLQQHSRRPPPPPLNHEHDFFARIQTGKRRRRDAMPWLWAGVSLLASAAALLIVNLGPDPKLSAEDAFLQETVQAYTSLLNEDDDDYIDMDVSS